MSSLRNYAGDSSPADRDDLSIVFAVRQFGRQSTILSTSVLFVQYKLFLFLACYIDNIHLVKSIHYYVHLFSKFVNLIY